MSETRPMRTDAPVSERGVAFFEQRGPVGVVLLHGFGGTPTELRGLGEALAGAGYTVHAPLLPGHGGLPEAMREVRWGQWAQAAEQALRRVQGVCRRAYVLGFSVGGLLALRLAAREQVAGVVALAPALRLNGQWLLGAVGLLKHVMPWYYPLERADFSSPEVRAAVRVHAPQADLEDPATVAWLRKVARVPVSALHEIVRLQGQVRRELPRVGVPALVLQGRLDKTVDPVSAEQVMGQVGSKDKRLVWLERSGHQLLAEAERELAERTVAAWLEAHAEAPSGRESG